MLPFPLTCVLVEKSLLEVFSPIKIKWLLFWIPACWKIRNSEDPLLNPKMRGLGASLRNWKSPKFWTFIPLAASLSLSSFSLSSFPLSLFLERVVHIYWMLLLSPSLLNVLCLSFCSYLSTKTVFHQHQWPLCNGCQWCSLNPNLTWYSSMKHNWLLPAPWSIFSCLPGLHSPSFPSLPGSSFSRSFAGFSSLWQKAKTNKQKNHFLAQSLYIFSYLSMLTAFMSWSSLVTTL